VPLRVDIVTAERLVYSEDGVDRIIVPGVVGELGVLPRHAPLLTMIQPGVLRIVKGADYEKKTGEWNTIELLTVDGTSVHVVNGKPNMVLTNSRRKVGDKEEPLTKGKIQLQSEGAEVFYRNIAIKPLEKIPEEYLK